MTTQRVERARTDTTVVWTEGLELVYERTFDAPRDLVWSVMTDPERITKWWGPHGYTTTVVEMDVRPGGKWRFINHTTGGEDVPFKGEYLEVVPPARLVQSFIVDVEPFKDMAAIETFTLEDLGGRTRAINRSTFPSIEALEGALATGMIGGAMESWDRLAVEIGKG